MRAKKWFCISCLLSFLLLSWGTLSTVGQQGPVEKDSEFSGKILIISTKSSADHGMYLQDVKIQKIEEVSFLVGTAVDTGVPGDWVKGRKVWVSVADVTMLVELDSIQDLKEFFEEELDKS